MRSDRIESIGGGGRGTGMRIGSGRSANKPKITNAARGVEPTKKGRKEAKATDIFVNRYSKSVKKSGSTKNPAQVAPKSVATGVKKMPAKKSK